MEEVWIIDGVRTPRGRGKSTGALHGIHPQGLAAQVLKGLADRAAFDVSEVDDVILGNGSNDGDHADDIARLAVLAAGWSIDVPGVTINRFWGSGQQAVAFAAMGIASGMQDLVVAGGVESMSRFIRNSGTSTLDGGNQALRKRFPIVPQGVSADLIATMEGLDRAAVDRFALTSQQRAARAIVERRFAHSMIPVVDETGSAVLDQDEHPRPETSLEGLARLAPAFVELGGVVPDGEQRTYDELACSVYPSVRAIDHVHHAGNSSGVVDGAAALVLASPSYARASGLAPRARFVTHAVAGAEPVIMLTAPEPASRRCLARAGMTVEDIDLWEINEAFAAVVLKTIKDLELDPDRVNVNGGAIALGHAIGATGAMLFQTVLDELERTDGSTALVTMCTGLGMATASILERI